MKYFTSIIAICAAMGMSATAHAQVQTFQGTAGVEDVFDGFLSGEADYFGAGPEYDQVDYEGTQNDYTYQLTNDGQLQVFKQSGGFDLLNSIEGIHFLGSGQSVLTDDLVGGNGGGSGNGQLTHRGQNVTLNGANVAWIEFGADVGNFVSTASQYRNRFRDIRQAGGNSARIWIHASGWLTPDIQAGGYVEGISSRTNDGITDAQVNQQVVEILDVAEDEGIVLNIVLFSFEMMCGEANNSGGQVHKGSRFNNMMNNVGNVNSYMNNVLDPLVRATQGHPALFSWEIFNEADGMTNGQDFFGDNCPLGSYPQSQFVLQRFVNFAAAEIRSIDNNVNITSSVSQPAFLNQYTNSVLTGQSFSNPNGTLDYYQAHWYHIFNHPNNPYSNSASSLGLDLPIVLGEYGSGDPATGYTEPETGTPENQLASGILDQGYAGAWLWDQTTEPSYVVEDIISGAESQTTVINFNN